MSGLWAGLVGSDYSGSVSSSGWGSGSGSASGANDEAPDHTHRNYLDSEERALWGGIIALTFICFLGILIAGVMMQPATPTRGAQFARLL